MTDTRTITLEGCAPVPLAHYLKALGVLRLVSAQAEAAALGAWKRDRFILHCSLDREGLLDFFLNRYEPTPILAPWNGGSGFFPKAKKAKKAKKAIEALTGSSAPRLHLYRDALLAAGNIVTAAGLEAKPDKNEKEALLQRCRNELSEAALEWIDAAYVLTGDGPKYPPLLGTGGNDGNMEFTNNFMQRLMEVIEPETGEPTAGSAPWLESSLFAETTATVPRKAPVGQFFPCAAGGANATSGFDAPFAVNPWDYLLMLEGAPLFAAASAKRLESAMSDQMVCPFCVRQAGVGYASAAASDESDSRAEMWMPLWERPASLAELHAILGEGRALVGSRSARNGVDFARAVVTFGVDRGLSGFQRYGFQERHGKNHFATPLDRVAVRRNARADLLSEFDGWLARLRGACGASAAPASVRRALGGLETRILDLCRHNDDNDDNDVSRLQGVLLALGQCERALARSLKWTSGSASQARRRPLSQVALGRLYGVRRVPARGLSRFHHRKVRHRVAPDALPLRAGHRAGRSPLRMVRQPRQRSPVARLRAAGITQPDPRETSHPHRKGRWRVRSLFR